MVVRALFLVILFPLLSLAAEPGACRIERLVHAKSACLGYHADLEIEAMETSIASATAGLQAAYADEILAFEAGLRQSQDEWRGKMEASCQRARPDDPVGQQFCRLEASQRRRARLEATLDDLQARLGVAPYPGFEIPDEVEVLVPLTVPRDNGPDSEVRVPLTIPITPR